MTFLTRRNVSIGAKHPKAVYYRLQELNETLHQRLYRSRQNRGEDVMEKDWDNLLIADCARFDYVSRLDSLPGQLTSIVSNGSSSEEFIRETFEGEEYHDTVYVTANAHYERLENQVFFHVERFYPDNTDASHQQLTENLAERTRELHSEYPNKRIITHFMQPHAPYVSQLAADIRERVRTEYGFTFDRDTDVAETESSGGLLSLSSLMAARRLGLIDPQQLRAVYREDLKAIVQRMETLAGELGGKTVITADHGELLGERLPPLFLRYWGHGNYLRSPRLREVPWLVIDADDRRDIETDEPIQAQNVDGEAVREHLRALGYR